jgi:hypothetical protein
VQTSDLFNLFGGAAGLISVVALVLKFVFERTVNRSLAIKNQAEGQAARSTAESTLANAIHATLVQPLQQEVSRMRSQLDNIDDKINEHAQWDQAILQLLEHEGLLNTEKISTPPPLR